MALRRLFSGWLIAMAALARSLAQALERASEDRSASTPDPVMAALAERYPGAPAHWLAHVAERTSQLADTGEAPFSLNSDPAAWPSPLPDGPAPRPLPIEAAPPPRRPEPTPRRDAEVPSLAALRERSSEVWRRPEPEPRRRPRPVFATAAERSTPSATPTAPTPAPRRPRSPLSVVAASPQGGIQGEVDPPRAAPEPDASAHRTAFHEASWPDPPAHRSATPVPSEDREAVERPRAAPVFTQAALKSLAPRSDAAQTEAAPPAAIRRQRAWFFAKPAPRHSGRPLDLSAIPSRGRGQPVEAATAPDATAPRPGFQYATTEPRVVGPDRIWRALTPSTARRTIFQALASLHAKTRRPADRSQLPEPRGYRAPPLAQPPSEAAPRPPETSAAPSPAAPSIRAVPAFTSSHAEGPARVVAAREPSRPAQRRRSSPPSVSAGEAGDEGRRAVFAAPRSVPPRPASRRFDDTPPDGRWPVLPPTTVTAPAGVEAAPPRWDVLAREQEEGRWNV